MRNTRAVSLGHKSQTMLSVTQCWKLSRTRGMLSRSLFSCMKAYPTAALLAKVWSLASKNATFSRFQHFERFQLFRMSCLTRMILSHLCDPYLRIVNPVWRQSSEQQCFLPLVFVGFCFERDLSAEFIFTEFLPWLLVITSFPWMSTSNSQISSVRRNRMGASERQWYLVDWLRR